MAFVPRRSEGSGSTDWGIQFWDPRMELRTGRIGVEFSARLVEWVRPRLKVDAPWRMDEPNKEENPIRWISWSFKTRTGSLNRFEGRFSRADLKRADEATLSRIVERGTDALMDVLHLAAQI